VDGRLGTSTAVRVDGRLVELQRLAGQLIVTVDGFPADLTFKPRDQRPTAVVTGDLAFDEAVYVQGPPLQTAARLDASTRALLGACVAEGASASEGAWRWTLAAPTPTPENEAEYAAALVVYVRRLLSLVELWSIHIPPQVALAAIAREDDDVSVRAMALLRLAVVMPGEPMVGLARGRLGAGLSSSQPDERVAAVILAYHEGDLSDLGPLQARWDLLHPGPERDCVAWAMEAIKGRHGPAAAGALSLASADGDLSVAADGGELSLGRRG